MRPPPTKSICGRYKKGSQKCYVFPYRHYSGFPHVMEYRHDDTRKQGLHRRNLRLRRVGCSVVPCYRTPFPPDAPHRRERAHALLHPHKPVLSCGLIFQHADFSRKFLYARYNLVNPLHDAHREYFFATLRAFFARNVFNNQITIRQMRKICCR